MAKRKKRTKQKIQRRRWEIEQQRKDKHYAKVAYKTYRDQSGHLHEIIKMPEQLDIYASTSATNDTLAIFNRLEKHQQSECKTLTLDFQNTINIKAAALVMLFATLDRLISEYRKNVRISGINHQKTAYQKTAKLLTQSGIIELCKKHRPCNVFDKPYLPIVSSIGGRYRDDIVDFIVQKIYGDMPVEMESIYADAIQEAINNVAAHAYLGQSEEVARKWWLLCEVLNDQLYLVIYDSGIGIPQSLPMTHDLSTLDFDDAATKALITAAYENSEEENKWLKELAPTLEAYLALLKENIQKSQDHYLSDYMKIAIAMNGNVTRKEGRDEFKHGQGSKSIKALVSCNDNGVLWIFSGTGRMKFTDEAELPNLCTLPGKLTGTLIQWNIKVTS